MGCNVCGGTGRIKVHGEDTACVCEIITYYKRYLKPFMGIGKVSENVKNFTTTILNLHKALEDGISRKYGIEQKMPRKWFMIDPFPVAEFTKNVQETGVKRGTWQNTNNNAIIEYKKWHENLVEKDGLGLPKMWYKHFFFQYLTTTNEYINYRMLNMSELVDIYYCEQDETYKDIDNTQVVFYGIMAKTIILNLDATINNREVLNILQQFLRYYTDRNIIIYATYDYRKIQEVQKWSETAHGYTSMKVGDRSLYEVLTTDFRNTFIDLMGELTYNVVREQLLKEGKDGWKHLKYVKPPEPAKTTDEVIKEK